MFNDRLTGEGGRPNVGLFRPRRYVSPADQGLPLVFDETFNRSFAFLSEGLVSWKENIPGGELAWAGQLFSEILPGNAGQEFMWQGGQEASSIAGICFAPTGSSMAHMIEHLSSVENHLMASSALDISYESHTTAVFFIGGIVEPGLFWKAFKCHSLGRPNDKKWSSTGWCMLLLKYACLFEARLDYQDCHIRKN